MYLYKQRVRLYKDVLEVLLTRSTRITLAKISALLLGLSPLLVTSADDSGKGTDILVKTILIILTLLLINASGSSFYGGYNQILTPASMFYFSGYIIIIKFC